MPGHRIYFTGLEVMVNSVGRSIVWIQFTDIGKRRAPVGGMSEKDTQVSQRSAN